MFFRRAKTYYTRPLPPRQRAKLNAAQDKVEGFELVPMQAAHVLMVGSGGIGSPVAAALVRKGLGRLTLLDDDRVELPNLTRQLFTDSDVGKYKAIQLAKHLARDGLFPTQICAQPFRFQELTERDSDFDLPDIIIAGVDNNTTRRAVTTYAIQHGIPVIHAAVGRDANALYVFVQEPDCACWGCAFPHMLDDASYPCNLPGIIDVLSVTSGLIVYAVDTIICFRPRHWHLREIFLDGSLPDRSRTIDPNPDCPLCHPRAGTTPPSRSSRPRFSRRPRS